MGNAALGVSIAGSGPCKGVGDGQKTFDWAVWGALPQKIIFSVGRDLQ